MAVHAYNSSTWETEAQGSRIPSRPLLPRMFEASLGCVKQEQQ